MTIKAVFLQNDPVGYDAVDLRNIYGSLIDTPGVVDGLAVTATSESRDIHISPGSAFFPFYPGGDAAEGLFHATNVESLTYAVPSASSGTRYIVAHVGEVGGVVISDQSTESVDTITLSAVNVTSGSAISPADIAPNTAQLARFRNSIAPQAVICTSKTRPTSNLVNGLRIYERDTGFMRERVKGQWVYLAGQEYSSHKISEILTQSADQKKMWKVVSANAIVRAGITQGYVRFEYRPKNNYSVPTSGNMKNSTICSIKDPYRTSMWTQAVPVPWGVLAYGGLASSGSLQLTALATPNDIRQGQELSLSWTAPYRLAR